MQGKKRKIGEILIDNNFITREILSEALEYQKKFGSNVTQYLIAYGYVTEEEVAKCITLQFGYPYLPLRAYDIPKQILKLVPSDTAEKYWLIPVDKIGSIITVVMADPFDEEAIKEVEKITKCKVQPFVGILSDIIKAIERHYNIYIEDISLISDSKAVPLFISTKTYKGLEHRKSIRLKANITVHFPAQNLYRESKTKDVSRHGFLFESNNILPVGSYVVLEINLPEEFSPYPIAAVVQVIRVTPLANKKFDIAVKTINLARDDADRIIKYALTLK